MLTLQYTSEMHAAHAVHSHESSSQLSCLVLRIFETEHGATEALERLTAEYTASVEALASKMLTLQAPRCTPHPPERPHVKPLAGAWPELARKLARYTACATDQGQAQPYL